MALPRNFLADLIGATQGGTVEPQQNTFGRLLAGLGNDPTQIPDAGALPTVGGMTAANAGPAPRVRRSVLDMVRDAFGSTRDENSLVSKIGGIADVIATVGGAQPLYQQNVDARRGRDIAAEDRQYQLDQRPLEMRLMEQKLASGDQNLEAGTLELQGARNQLLESAGMGLRQVFGRTGAAGLQKAWPIIAAQLGIPQDQAAEIAQGFAADPEGTLSALFPDPMAGKVGSQAKEAQIYELLTREGSPEQAAAYLQSLTNPDAMTPKQIADLALAREKFDFERYKFANPAPSAAERTATAKEASAQGQRQELASSARAITDQMRDAFGRLKNAGGMSAQGQGFGGRLEAWANSEVPLVERLTNPEGYSARQDINRLLTTGIPTLLPLLGGLTLGGKNMDAAKELDTWRNAIASATDYDSAMRAVGFIESRIKAIERGGTATPSRRAAPRQGGGGQRQAPAAPKVGVVRQGYKFMGGDPANPKSWRKVQ